MYLGEKMATTMEGNLQKGDTKNVMIQMVGVKDAMTGLRWEA